MLAFHGTGGPRSLIDKIFEEGLTPAPHTWTGDTTGIDAHVFACTSPIGGKGGDPIHFAQRRLYGTKDTAWLLVLDVPPSSVRGAVQNHELEQYFVVQAFSSSAFERGPIDLRDLILHKRECGVATRDLLEYDVTETADNLTQGAPDAHTLVQFEHAFIRARDVDDKRRVAASYNLTLPEGFLDDPHWAWCQGCMHQLFSVDIVASGIPTPPPPSGREPPPPSDRRFSRGAWQRLDLTHFGSLVDALDRWLAAHGDAPLAVKPPPRVEAGARAVKPPRVGAGARAVKPPRGGAGERAVKPSVGAGGRAPLAVLASQKPTAAFASLAALQRAYPPPRDQVPRAMWSDFVTHDLETRMREPDTQILLDHVPPAQIVGAIDLGSRTRLSNLVRPRAGETLMSKLEHLAGELVRRRKRSGRPLLVES